MIDVDVLESTSLLVPKEAIWVTFDDVTSGEKAPIGRILRNFRLCMRAPHPREPPLGSRVLWSLPVAMTLLLLYYIHFVLLL